MGNVIRFDHIKRCRRFFRILIGQHGLAYFVIPRGRMVVPHEPALRESVAFASDWMALRTGAVPTEATRAVMYRELVALVNDRLKHEVIEVVAANFPDHPPH